MSQDAIFTKKTNDEYLKELEKISIEKLTKKIDLNYKKTVTGFVPTDAIILGVRVPDIRSIAREIKKEIPAISLNLVTSFMDKTISPVTRELFLLNIFLITGFKDFYTDKALWKKIDVWADSLLDWEMTDQLGGMISGEMVVYDLSRTVTLKKWLKSRSVWKRRLALISTIAGNHKKRKNTQLAIEISRPLMKDKAPNVYKAVGFALREACRAGGGKEVFQFLMSEKNKANKKTIIESAKKLSEKEQKQLLV
ncbi:MAG: DNA alkylation repair protein [Spirochaetia bacterium]|nr:DNA alkylation repair protein [Spirochaetia bacterium]